MKSEEREIGGEVPGFMYAGIWFFFGVSMSFGNKIVFNYTDFKYPVLLSTLHMLVNSILVYAFVHYTKLVPEEKKKLTAEERRSIRYFVIIFCLNIAFGNISIRIVDLALSQMLRATMPVFSLTLSYLVLGQTSSKFVVLTLIPIVAGVAMMSITNVQFSLWNAIIIFIGIVLCAIKGVQTHVTLKQHKIHPFVLLMHLAPMSSIVMFLLSFVFLDVPHLYSNFGQVFLSMNVAKNVMIPLLTALIAFVLNILSFLANRGTSPLTMAVLGNIKQATVIFTSIYIFKSEISWFGIFGILVAVIGMFLYTFARYKHGKSSKASVSREASSPNRGDKEMGGNETPTSITSEEWEIIDDDDDDDDDLDDGNDDDDNNNNKDEEEEDNTKKKKPEISSTDEEVLNNVDVGTKEK